MPLPASFFILIVLLAPAASDAAFSAPINLSVAGQDALYPQVAIDADGDALPIWTRLDGAGPGCYYGTGCFRIQVRPRSATGVLQPPQTISTSNDDADKPQVAVDVDGDAFAVWRHFPGGFGGSNLIRGRARTASTGALGPVQALCPGCIAATENPQVGVDADGDALAVWQGFDGTHYRVLARARTAGSGTLGPLHTLSAAGQHAENPQVAVEADGDALVVWERPDGTTQCGGGPCSRIQLRTRTAAGSVGPIQTLSTGGQHAENPQVGVDADGDAVFVWQRSDGGTGCAGGPCVRIQARPRTASTGALGAVQTLSPVGQYGLDPQVAVDADGDAIAVWHRNSRIEARKRTAGTGALGAVQTLSGCCMYQPQVAVDAAGNAVAVWSSGSLIEARTRAATGALGPVQKLSAPSSGAFDPQVAVAADGSPALAVWRRHDGTTGTCCWRIQGAAGP